jgi:hypothetical protein
MNHAQLALASLLVALGAGDSTDIRTVPADLQVPALEHGPAAAGKRMQEVLPEYASTNVHHVTYLPSDWHPSRRYPVIVEFAGNGNYRNQFGDISQGRVEDSKLGYGISAGKGFVWVCLPYLNHQGTENVITWWGDPPRYDPHETVEYCKKAIPWICEQYNGAPDQVVLTGFSRGAIACNFLGLHDPEIAKLWCAFVPYSHYDGVVGWAYPSSDRAAALDRLRRLGDRPQFICAETGSGKHAVNVTREYLKATGVTGSFTFRSTGFRNHNNAWILRPSQARDDLRRWVESVLR